MQHDDGLLPGTGAALLTARFCSELSAELGLPLIGSAGSYDAVLAFELDTPWTAKIAGSRASDERLDEAIAHIGKRAKTLRLLALEPAAAGSDRATILFFRREPGSFSGYAKTQYLVKRAKLAKALEALALDEKKQPEALDTPATRDLLVCTHGARDACCAKFGFPIYRRLVELAAASGEGDLQVWRCSHLGGHRFAPTLLDLPSGRMFGRLRDDDVPLVLGGGDALAARAGEIYRGRCVLPEAAQIVERDLWMEAGAAFEKAALEWSVEKDGKTETGKHWRVELHAEHAAFGRRSATKLVELAKLEAVEAPASCGRDPEPEAPWKIVG